MKKNNIPVIFLCLITATINASFLPSEKRQKDELIASCPPGEKLESGYEPLKAFSDNGVTTLIVPKEDSIYYLGLKSIIDNSITFKNSQKDHPGFFTSGSKLTFGPESRISTDQVNDLLKLVAGDEMALTNREYLEGKIGRQKLFTIIQTIGTAEFLDLPLLLQIAIDQVAKNLQDTSLLSELNANPAYITELFSPLSSAMQKELSKKILASISYRYKRTHQFEFLFSDPSNPRPYKFPYAPFALSNDGSRIVFYTNYKQHGRVYDLKNEGQPSEIAKFAIDLSSAQFNPTNSDVIALDINNKVSLFNTAENTGILLQPAMGEMGFSLIAFDATGGKLATSSNRMMSKSIKIWDTQTGESLNEIISYDLRELEKFNDVAAFNPTDNNMIAIAMGSEVVIWNLKSAHPEKKLNTEGTIVKMIFDNAGKKLAIATQAIAEFQGRDKKISKLYVIDLTNEKKLVQEKFETPTALAFSSPDNNELVFFTKKHIHTWNLMKNIIEASEDFPFSYLVAFNKDLSVAADISSRNKISIWKKKNYKPILESLTLEKLIIFRIADKIGLAELNKEYDDKLPQAVKDLLK